MNNNVIELSEIQILPVKPCNGLIAFASFVLNNQFYVSDIAIYTTPNGYSFRLVYPAKKLINGKMVNIFKPINKCAGEAISLAIISKYKALIMDREAKRAFLE